MKVLGKGRAAAFAAILLAAMAPAIATDYPATQGWGPRQMRDWYELTQGSRLIPMDWLRALIRNWTEAFGVFATSELSQDTDTVSTSIRLDNLLRIEQALATLQSPTWPDTFGPVDSAEAARGAVLFKDKCSGCHGAVDSSDTDTPLPLIEKPGSATTPGFIYLQPLFAGNARPEDFADTIAQDDDCIGTDPGMACNAMMHIVPAGRPWPDAELGSAFEEMMAGFKAAQFQDVNTPGYWSATDAGLAAYNRLIGAVQERIITGTAPWERRISGRFLSPQTLAPPVDLERKPRRCCCR